MVEGGVVFEMKVRRMKMEISLTRFVAPVHFVHA